MLKQYLFLELLTSLTHWQCQSQYHHAVSKCARVYRYKRTEYAARSIAEYWIIDPQERQITVCKWIDGLYEDTVIRGSDRVQSDLVPDFGLNLDQIFNA